MRLMLGDTLNKAQMNDITEDDLKPLYMEMR